MLNENTPIPKISVLMPVYNGAQHVREAIDSILNQTFSDFEFLIINDGSTDNSTEIIRSYADPRIKLFHNERNSGLTFSLNRGINLASGEYIARMDSDDISLPERFAIQVKLMDEQRDVGICGCWFQYMHNQEVIALPTDPEIIKVHMFFGNVLGHPTVLMRTAFLKEHHLCYDEKYHFAQDYDMWTRCYLHFKIANINQVLLHYRVHHAQMSSTYGQKVWTEPDLIKLNQVRFLGVMPTIQESELHRTLLNGAFLLNKTYVAQALNWIEKLINANDALPVYKEEEFNTMLHKIKTKLLKRYREEVFIKRKTYSLPLLKEFYFSSYRHYLFYNTKFQLYFIAKCILGMGK